MNKKFIILFLFPLSLLLLSFSQTIGSDAITRGADAKLGFIGAESLQGLS